MNTLEEQIRSAIVEKSAGQQAVETLTQVRPRIKGEFGSDIELKTDLSKDDVVVHTVIDEINRILTMDEADFKTLNVLSTIVERKERKLLSKNRQSRDEVIRAAVPPEIQESQRSGGFLKRLFTPRGVK